MRKLVWFALGFATACAACAYALINGWWLLLLGIIGLCAAIPIFYLKTKASKICALLLLGCAVGFCWCWGYDAAYLRTARDHSGESDIYTVEITDYSYDKVYGSDADGRIILDGKPFRIRVYLDTCTPLKPGDTVTGLIQLRLPSGKQSSYPGDGFFLIGFARDVQIQHCDETPAKHFPAKLRAVILSKIEEFFPADTYAFAKALLLGDTYDLDYEQNAAYQISGIRHVVAVSGLHVAILFSVVYLLSGRHRVLSAVIGIPVLVLFAALAGLTPSVLRACIMQGLVLLALLCNREYDPPTALAASVVIMLLANPMIVTSVSFQLSVGCMVGIFLFSQGIKAFLLRRKLGTMAKGKGFLARLIRWSVSSVAVTLSAMVITVPFCAWHFGAVSLIGVITNLLCLWVISYIFYGIMLACIAGALWLPLGKSFAWLISWAIRYVDAVAATLSKIPFAAVYTCSGYIVLWLLMCYCLLGVFLKTKKHPLFLSGCMAVGLCAALLLSWIEPQLDPYRLTVYDVGQGQSILLQCDGKNYLIDCGGDNDTFTADLVSQQLQSQGIAKLDGAIATHYHRDHVGAMGKLLSRVGTEKLYLPDIADDGQYRRELSKRFSDAVCWVQTDMRITHEKFTIQLIPATIDTDENESSMCILFQTENCDILITGDRGVVGEKDLLSRCTLPELELLVVGHHGSATSTGSELLLQTRPENAVISVGQNHFYDQPSQKVLRRLRRFDTRVWRTDLHGTILFRG